MTGSFLAGLIADLVELPEGGSVPISELDLLAQ